MPLYSKYMQENIIENYKMYDILAMETPEKCLQKLISHVNQQLYIKIKTSDLALIA